MKIQKYVLLGSNSSTELNLWSLLLLPSFSSSDNVATGNVSDAVSREGEGILTVSGSFSGDDFNRGVDNGSGEVFVVNGVVGVGDSFFGGSGAGFDAVSDFFSGDASSNSISSISFFSIDAGGNDVYSNTNGFACFSA